MPIYDLQSRIPEEPPRNTRKSQDEEGKEEGGRMNDEILTWLSQYQTKEGATAEDAEYPEKLSVVVWFPCIPRIPESAKKA